MTDKTHLTKDDARQGERIKGMPIVLGLSTAFAAGVLLTLLLLNI